jgi:GT2 family glycosyltransferase
MEMAMPTGDSSAQLLYIVILNWNRPADTIACLRATVRSDYPNFRALLVDNGSTDDSVAQIRRTFPEIPLLQNKTNLGYAAGNNVGIRYALMHGAEYILLLNNDAFVERDTFSRLVAATVDDPTVAAAGCKVHIFEDPRRLWAAGECFVPRGNYPLDDGRFDTLTEIDYAVGCCILMRRNALEDVGLLDAEFFAIHEERDWCYRARDAGYRILYVPGAVVYHKVSTSLTSGWSPAYHYLCTRNQLRLWERRGIIPPNWRRLRGVFLAWRSDINFVRRHGSRRLRRAWAVTRGALDYVQGRFGPPPDGLWDRKRDAQ